MNVTNFIAAYPSPVLQFADFGGGNIGWREQGVGPAIVLLHGISSGATAWAKQFADPVLTQQARLFAWDAPGYGDSTPLSQPQPQAQDYARALNIWLTGLRLDRVLLVGHSLGALMASAYAAQYPDRVRGLVLVDPAQGYATAPTEQRQQIYQQRMAQFTQLGPVKYARQRSVNLLRVNPNPADLAQIQYGMSRLHSTGLQQATWLLANSSIDQTLAQYHGPLAVWCGADDIITPPGSAEQLALRYQAEFVLLPAAGHASYLDAASEFNQQLGRWLQHLVR